MVKLLRSDASDGQILSSRRRGGTRTKRADNQSIFVQPACQCAVVERRAATGLQTDHLRQAEVAAQQKCRPACEALLKRISQARVESGKGGAVGEPRAVWRI